MFDDSHPDLRLEPSSLTRRLMVHAYKQPLDPLVKVRGLFGCSSYPLHVVLFLCMIVLEVTGIHQILGVTDATPQLVIWFVGIDLCIDLVLGLAHHLFGSTVVPEAQIETLEVEGEQLMRAGAIQDVRLWTTQKRMRLNSVISRRRWIARAFAGGLIAVALVKVLLYVTLTDAELSLPTLGIGLAYFACAAIHLEASGPVLMGGVAYLLFLRERHDYVHKAAEPHRTNPLEAKKARTIDLSYSTELEARTLHGEIQEGQHRIRRVVDESGQPLRDDTGRIRCELAALGLLTDEQLRRLSLHFSTSSSSQRRDLLVRGLHLQIASLNTHMTA